MNKYLRSALSGLAATLPMTGVMFALRNQLRPHEKHPLPPEEITEELAARAGADHLSRTEHQIATWLAHFAFGAGAGVLYAPLAEKVEATPVIKGAAFGLLVWAVSYLGWLPGLGILNQPQDQPARPNGLMIAAHLVWGAILGLLSESNTNK